MAAGMGETLVDDLTERRAKKLLQQGMQQVADGEFERALESFKASAEQFPSADAFTYWGWMEQRRGKLEKAIELCKEAIELDPNFGNPYNDIGAYLVSLGREEEAIGWFQKAVSAERYEPRQYPHINLGRIFMSKNQYIRALREFEQAYRYVPEDGELAKLIRTLRDSLH
jgi:Tfp pilus assembly protein PilF